VSFQRVAHSIAYNANARYRFKQKLIFN